MLTDIELANALRYGQRPEGGTLLPFMELSGLSDEDIIAIISYLRSLPPVHSEVKVRDINWFGRTLIKLFVHSKGPSSPPPKHSPTGPSKELGEYLTNHVAMCVSCHSRRSSTGGYKGKRLSGGFHMADELNSSQELATPNLTPDSATGHIVNWTEERFIARFRQGRLIPGSPMPWSSYALMSETDLRSIYRYLMSLAPVRHDVGLIVRTKH